MSNITDLTIARFDQEWRAGDRDLARKLALEYVKANKTYLAPILANLTISELVRLIEAYRAANNEQDRIIADMWLLTQPVRAVDAPPRVTAAPHIMCSHSWCLGEVADFIRSKHISVAKGYIDTHRENLAPVLENKSLTEIVGMIDFYRDLGQADNATVADMWLRSEYAPQSITGVINLSGKALPQ